MWRKSVVNVYPLWPEMSLKCLMVGENFENTLFWRGFIWQGLFLLVATQCVLLHLFSVKKVRFLVQKSQKRDFWHFWVFFFVRARALEVLATVVAKRNRTQPKTLRVRLHSVTTTRKAVGVFFETHFHEKIRFLANLAKKSLWNVTGRVLDCDVSASSVLLLVWGTLHSAKNRI